jgi:hypothetical protein
MWSMDLQCLIVEGKQLTFSDMEDVYFLIGLPFQGMALPADSQLQGDVRLIVMAWDYCLGMNPMSGLVVWIEATNALLHQCITAMIVRIYGSLVTHRINGGQLRIM